MDNTLVERFQKLRKERAALESKRASVQAQHDLLVSQQEERKAELFSKYKVSTLEEARQAKVKMEDTLSKQFDKIEQSVAKMEDFFSGDLT